jgi:thioredoxin-related protein
MIFAAFGYNFVIMKKVFLFFGALFLLHFSVWATDPNLKEAETKVEWLSFEDAVKKAEKSPKKIFIDVYTNWCGWCKKMDRSTFSAEKIVLILNKDYYPVKLNAESKRAIDVKGESTTPRAVARKFNVSAYPTTVYLDENQNLIQSIPGYQNADNLDMILNYFGGDFHKNTNFKEFQQNYNK